MSDDDSNDVVMVENTEASSKTNEAASADTESRPIMQLFQRLTSNDTKQNTVLTNAQIISILHKEFEIDITTLHELEVEIYLNIVKRFLKDWPKWDEFDQGINTLRKKNAYKSIRKTLEFKYVDLKNYLKTQLELTKPLAQEAVNKMIKDNTKRMEKVDTSEIILEVYCTRKQLNELVLSQPIPGDCERTVFNVTEFNPTSITLNKLPIESILNWYSVQISIDAQQFNYQRATNHQVKHILVNSKIGPRNFTRILKTQIQIKEVKRTITEDIDKEKIFKYFENLIQNESILNHDQKTILVSLMEIVKNDLHAMDKIKVPATYRQYSTRYPYFRKLRKEVQSDIPSLNLLTHDLYIEETIAPMHTFAISLPPAQMLKTQKELFFMVECIECKLKFCGDEMYTLMREHFDTYHSNEPDWSCTNCEKTFTMTELARNKWHHYCS